jgi:hypothetical protein
MNEAEDTSEPVPILAEAQLTVSDAIENELRRQEAGYPPTVRSRFFGALEG